MFATKYATRNTGSSHGYSVIDVPVHHMCEVWKPKWAMSRYTGSQTTSRSWKIRFAVSARW